MHTPLFQHVSRICISLWINLCMGQLLYDINSWFELWESEGDSNLDIDWVLRFIHDQWNTELFFICVTLNQLRSNKELEELLNLLLSNDLRVLHLHWLHVHSLRLTLHWSHTLIMRISHWILHRLRLHKHLGCFPTSNIHLLLRLIKLRWWSILGTTHLHLLVSIVRCHHIGIALWVLVVLGLLIILHFFSFFD